MDYVEIIGYLASILVAISLTMSKILRLRVVNLCGAVCFAIYGFILGAYPVFIVNSFIILINLYYLQKMYRNRDVFDIMNVSKDSSYLKQFYKHYREDILKFFPNFSEELLKEKHILFILRNMRPVNIVIFREQENSITEILLDYTIPEYRDFLNGRYLLSILEKGSQKNRQLVVKSQSKRHNEYLKRLGFHQNGAGLFVKKV